MAKTAKGCVNVFFKKKGIAENEMLKILDEHGSCKIEFVGPNFCLIEVKDGTEELWVETLKRDERIKNAQIPPTKHLC